MASKSGTGARELNLDFRGELPALSIINSTAVELLNLRPHNYASVHGVFF